MALSHATERRVAPGDTLWAFEGDGSFRSSPTVVDGTVYAGTTNRTLYAVDAETATEQWRFRVGPEPPERDKAEGIWAPPHVKGGRVFVGANDYNVYALDADSGDELWRYETDSHVYSSPTVVDGVLYVSGRDKGMYALDPATGEELWANEIGISGASPSVVDGSVYSGSYTIGGAAGGKIASFDAETGDEEWRYEGVDSCSSPTVVDGTVFTGALDEYVYALDADTGKLTWRTALPGSQDIASPTVKDGTVFVTGWGSEVGLRALDADTGEQVWHAPTYSAGHQSPTVVGDSVFVVNQNGVAYAVDRATGEVRWERRLHDGPIQNATQGSAVVVDGVLFAGGEDERLRAVATDVDGSSDGSRVRDGVLNHHHSWAGTEPQTLDVERTQETTTSPATTTSAPESGYGDWFEGVDNYRGTVDRRGESTVTVAVGAGENGTAFSPAAVLVDPGTTVRWEWTGEGGSHNVVSRDESVRSDTTDEAGYTVSATLERDGVLRYFCRPHRPAGMKGAVAVGSVDDELVAPSDAEGTPTAETAETTTEGRPATTGDAPDGTATATDGSGGSPGLGVLAALAGLGGAGYLLGDRDEE